MHDFFKHFFGFHEKKIKIVALEKMTRKKQKKKASLILSFLTILILLKKRLDRPIALGSS